MSTQVKLLIVEDDENFARLITRALEGLADEAEVVNDWHKAFIHIETEKDDALWADLRMPGTSEEESIERIKMLRESNPKIVIIVGSGFITPHVRSKLNKAGVDAVFYKDAGFKAEQVASLIVLGIMRANMRTPNFYAKLLTKALEWMHSRYPATSIP